MMKRTAVLSLSLFALAACGSSSSTAGGSSSSGGSSGSASTSAASSSSSSSGSSSAGTTFNITLSQVGVHPAAVAALAAVGLTPPSLANGYHLNLQGVTLKNGSPSLSYLGSQVELSAANDTGPITFPNINVSGGVTSLGLISAISPDYLPDGGAPPTPPPPTCAQLAALPATGDAGPGFTDYFVVAAAQVYFGTPTADVTNGVAFALPESYIAMLDCAAGLVPGAPNDLLNNGISLLYASASPAGQGAPLTGVTFGGGGSGSFLYFPAGYTAASASANGPTSANGIATISGVTGLGTVTATDTASDTFKSRDLATEGGSVYQVFYAPGT